MSLLLLYFVVKTKKHLRVYIRTYNNVIIAIGNFISIVIFKYMTVQYASGKYK